MKKLKRNNYLQGAFIATFGIVISKILGMIYVIPFYSIIGEQGGALYGYAYNIYSIFLSISTAGIPLAISSIVSEYNTLGYQNAKEKTFTLAKRYLSIVGIISFLIVFIFAKDIAFMIIGNNTGGNSIEDITFVIRTISFSILIVPTLSVYRGYLQGHKFITPTSISQVIEQVVRVSIIIVGSFIAAKVFHLPLKYAVACALLGATIGALFSYLYLVVVKKKNKSSLKTKASKDERKISTKEILTKIFITAFPFIFGDVCKSLYNSVDTFFVVKTLTGLGYKTIAAESIMGIISTWGNKLNMIVIAIGTGFAVSLIPNMTSSIVKKDYKDVNLKINQTFKTLLFITMPMTFGLSFLSVPIWNTFYGSSMYGPVVFRFSIIVALVTVILSAVQVIGLTFKEYKILIPSMILGLLLNALLDVPLMIIMHNLGAPAFYGATLSTCLGHILTITIILYFIINKYKFNLKESVKAAVKTTLYTITMLIGLYLISFIIPLNVSNRILSLLIVLIYAVIGGIIYGFISFKSGLFQDVFGQDIFIRIKRKIKSKLPLKKRGI